MSNIPYWLKEVQSDIPLSHFRGDLNASRVSQFDSYAVSSIEDYFGITQCKEDCDALGGTPEEIQACKDACKELGGSGIDLLPLDNTWLGLNVFEQDVWSTNFITTGSETVPGGGSGPTLETLTFGLVGQNVTLVATQSDGNPDVTSNILTLPISHTHSNKAVLDQFGEDGSGYPTFNGNKIDTVIAQRDVYDGLDSADNTISLAATQGKVLNDKFSDYITETDSDNKYAYKAGTLGQAFSAGTMTLNNKLNGVNAEFSSTVTATNFITI